MNSKAATPPRAVAREFPERLLVADIAHPDGDGVELAILSEEVDPGDLPLVSYMRDDAPWRTEEAATT